MVAIVIICYNIDSTLFLLQMEALKKFCKDDFVVEIVDNSFDEEKAEGIRYHCDIMGISYKRTKASSNNGSDSHAFAANLSFEFLKDKYDTFAYFDHDLFAIKPFSVVEILGEKILAGVGQGLKAKYMWPGCLFFCTDGIDKKLVDFSPDHKLGLDTGAGFHKIIESYGEEECIFFNEEYHQNPNYTGEYNFYSLIHNGTFLHCINASNWNPIEGNENRLNSLISIIKEKIDEAE